MRLRLFVAVAVPADVGADLHEALAGLRREHDWLRWTDPSDWHLTLAFLGWVEEERAGEAAAAVRAGAQGHAPFSLRLDGRLGSFGRRVLWAGVEDPGALASLAADVRSELATREVEFDERDFRSHLTVARAPRGRRAPPGLGEDVRVPERDWRVEEALLMRSQLGRGGARYEVQARAPLE